MPIQGARRLETGSRTPRTNLVRRWEPSRPRRHLTHKLASRNACVRERHFCMPKGMLVIPARRTPVLFPSTLTGSLRCGHSVASLTRGARSELSARNGHLTHPHECRAGGSGNRQTQNRTDHTILRGGRKGVARFSCLFFPYVGMQMPIRGGLSHQAPSQGLRGGAVAVPGFRYMK